MSSPIRVLLCCALAAASLIVPAGPAVAAPEDADLSVSITHDPAAVEAGEDVSFTFLVSNAGPGNVISAMLEFDVAGGRLWSRSGSGFGYDRQYLDSTGPLASGESKAITIVVRAGSQGSIAIDADVAASESSPNPDPAPGNNSAADSATVLPVTRNAWKSEGSTGPRSMWGSGYAYHPTMGSNPTGRAFAFGGLTVNDVLSNGYRTWAEGWGYGEGNDTTIDPDQRVLPAMAHNPADQTLVLFGGFGADGLSNETWLLGANGAWTKKTPATSPPARYGAHMAMAGGKLILFGGEGESGPLNDTWTWNGSTWTKITTAVAPPARMQGIFVGDPVRGNAVLFGGCCEDDIWSMGDTWTFDGSAWTKRNPAAGPSARESAVAAFDLNASAVAMFGGLDNNGDVLGDLWTWNGSGWQSVATTGTLPSPREGGTLFFAQNTRSEPGRLLLYGGADDAGDLMSDTYTIALSGPSAVASPDALAFGAVPVGAAANPKIVTVTNSGSEPVSVTGTAVGGTHAADYSANASACAAPLAPGAHCEISVGHTSKGTGVRSAVLSVSTDSGSPLAVALSATGVAPTLTTPGLVSGKYVNASFPVSWAGNAAGVVYDVEWMERYRTSAGHYADGAWRRWKTGAGAGSAWFGGSGQPASVPGHTYLFRVRARSGSATGPWTAIKSAVVPVDDRSNWLGWSSGWASQTASGRYYATQRIGTRSTQWMTLVTDTNMFTIVGERCSSCGQFRVYLDGKLIATVDTYAKGTAYRQTLYSRYMTGGIRRHSLKIVPVGTAGRPSVKIDAVGLAR